MQPGDVVALRGLSQKNYNGKIGVVLGFNRQRERFAVKLEDSSVKLFRGRNLWHIPRNWTSVHSSLNEKLNCSKSLESLMKVRSDIENLCGFDEAGEILRTNCVDDICCRTNDRSILKELLESVEQQIERCAFPLLIVKLKLHQACSTKPIPPVSLNFYSMIEYVLNERPSTVMF